MVRNDPEEKKKKKTVTKKSGVPETNKKKFFYVHQQSKEAGRKPSRCFLCVPLSKKKKDSNKEKPLSVDEALKQADAALSAAVETRHLAGSGSAAVKARKKSNGGAGRNDSQWRQSAM